MSLKPASKSMGYGTPTTPAAEGLAPALARNIEALVERRKRDAKTASFEERTAAAISRFAGSMPFVYIHLAFFGAWIALNLGVVSFIKPFDPSLVILAMFASVEAIFLSTFVLINQNRMAAEDDARADLDLQVSLLNEHETTKLIKLVEEIAKRLDVNTEADDELEELKRDVAPEAVLDKIEEMGEREMPT
ncbi:putative membrane protein [Mesorhizobium plurifarium]|uniref:Putative membrane protein n=1 Tax=Mesorhizobium plurifarium TaxID=69974 RepID=A0A090FCW4_MESPL|nr:putative membrane protein [Mesorhizobium plurifarium]